MSSGVGEEDSSEKGLLKRAGKNHRRRQMAKKGKKSKIQSLETLVNKFP